MNHQDTKTPRQSSLGLLVPLCFGALCRGRKTVFTGRSRMAERIRFILNRCWIAMASTLDTAGRSKSTAGITAVGIFLFFGAVMAGYAGTTLIWRGTVLDKLWALNMPAYERLAPFGAIAGPVFLAAQRGSGVCWGGMVQTPPVGMEIGHLVILVQALGDLINLLRGDFIRGGIGLAIAGLLLFYLLRPKVRVLFEQSGASGTR